jgi:hypothetical protein
MTARMTVAQADIEAKRPPSLPLGGHVAASLEWHWYWKFHGPPPGEKWTTPTWGLIRLLRGHPDLAMMNGGEGLMALEKVFQSWPTPGREHPTAYWIGLPKADVQAQIVFGWNSVKYAAGFGPLDAALAQARETPLPLPPKDYGGEDYETFISAMGWLQVIAGEVDIYIPCHAVGKLIGVSHNTISLYRQTAVKQGYLTPGKVSTGRHEADEFGFVLAKFPVLVTAATEVVSARPIPGEE